MNRHSVTGECESNYAAWKPDQAEKPCIKWVHCISLGNVNCSDRRWISGCLGMGLEVREAWVIKEREDILGVICLLFWGHCVLSVRVSKLIILHQIVCQFQLHRAVKKKKKRKFKCNRYLGKAEGQTGEEQTLFPVTHIFFSIMVYRRILNIVLGTVQQDFVVYPSYM